jgi:hypothetical protein
MVFMPPATGGRVQSTEGVQYNDQNIELVQSFKYLGVYFTSNNKTIGGPAGEHRVKAGYYALHMMRRRCAELGIKNVWLQTELFDALVKPVITYGSEIWATEFLLHPQRQQDSWEILFRAFLKQSMGVHDKTPTDVILAEVGKYPIWFSFAKSVTRFWARLTDMPNDRLVKIAFHTSIKLGEMQQHLPVKRRSWAGQAQAFFTDLGLQSSATVTPKEQQVMDRLKDTFIQSIVGCSGTKTKFYVQYVRNNDLNRDTYLIQPYLTKLMTYSTKTAMAQFRTGSHWLRVESGRWLTPHVPHNQRQCLRCEGSAVDNEFHMVFTCPTLEVMRNEYSDLFTDIDQSRKGAVHHFLQQNPQRVALFLAKCRELCEDS